MAFYRSLVNLFERTMTNRVRGTPVRSMVMKSMGKGVGCGVETQSEVLS